MDVVVEVGGWEHECCGPAIERDQLIDVECIRYTEPDGSEHLAETHHDRDAPVRERVRGRVVDLRVVRAGDEDLPILRVPSGEALRHVDDNDDGHLEDPWTGGVLASSSHEFLVTVRTSPSS